MRSQASYTLVFADRSSMEGGFSLSGAIDVARQAEAGSGRTVVRVIAGDGQVHEGEDLRARLNRG